MRTMTILASSLLALAPAFAFAQTAATQLPNQTVTAPKPAPPTGPIGAATADPSNPISGPIKSAPEIGPRPNLGPSPGLHGVGGPNLGPSPGPGLVDSTPALTPADADFLSETAQLDRQIKILEKKAQIADLQKKINNDQHPSAAMAAPPSLISAPPQGFAQTAGADPQVVSKVEVKAPPPQHVASIKLAGVIAIGAARQATVIDHGVSIQVRDGSLLPSGWTVENIEPSGVVLRKGRAHRRLVVGD